MPNPYCALEITSKSLRLLIGFEKEGQVYSIYSTNRSIEGAIENGQIVDKSIIVKELKKLTSFYDEASKLTISIPNVLLVLPPYGFEVFNEDKLTTTVSADGVIQQIDISNLYNQIKNDRIPPINNSFVDVIPDSFILDSGARFIHPPVGQSSKTVHLYAKLHTLPTDLINSYVNVVKEAGMNPQRLIVAPFGAALALKSEMNTPQSYLLVDIGSTMTTVSLIGEDKLYASQHFLWGGDNITNRIKDEFKITYEEAEKLKCVYGRDTREMDFEIPLCKGKDGLSHTVKELNALIEKELQTFTELFNNSREILLSRYDAKYQSIPMILIGGGSLLYGFKEFIEPKVPSEEIKIATPKTFGVRNPSYYNVIGTVLLHARYKNTFKEMQSRITQVSRVEK